MTYNNERVDTPSSSDERIVFILGHPGFSAWLKDAIRSALPREPLAVLNDLEILNQVLGSKCRAEAANLTRPGGSPDRR